MVSSTEISEYEFVREQICALQEFYKRMTHKEKPIYLLPCRSFNCSKK